MSAIPTPGGDDDAEARLLAAAEQIVISEGENVGLEGIFGLAVRIGVMLNEWAKLMSENYSQDWVEDSAMTLFNQFFKPFVPPFPFGHDHDDD